MWEDRVAVGAEEAKVYQSSMNVITIAWAIWSKFNFRDSYLVL